MGIKMQYEIWICEKNGDNWEVVMDSDSYFDKEAVIQVFPKAHGIQCWKRNQLIWDNYRN